MGRDDPDPALEVAAPSVVLHTAAFRAAMSSPSGLCSKEYLVGEVMF